MNARHAGVRRYLLFEKMKKALGRKSCQIKAYKQYEAGGVKLYESYRGLEITLILIFLHKYNQL